MISEMDPNMLRAMLMQQGGQQMPQQQPGLLQGAAQPPAAPPPPPQYQGFNPAALQSVPEGLLNRFGNYQMQAYNPAVQAQGLLQSMGQLQMSPQQLGGATGPPVTPPTAQQPGARIPGVVYRNGGQGDAAARGNYRNDNLPSQGFLDTISGLPGMLGMAGRGLSHMAGGNVAGSGRSATDSHGQVRGGGTGSRSGGLTAGGPR